VQENKKYIVYFDGVCNVCDGLIQFIRKRDKQKTFSFLSLQSPEGVALLHEFKDLQSIDSIVVVGEGKYYIFSDAILKIASLLPGFQFKIVKIIKILPLSLRTKLYKWFAKNRYKWFGKKDICLIADKS